MVTFKKGIEKWREREKEVKEAVFKIQVMRRDLVAGGRKQRM